MLQLWYKETLEEGETTKYNQLKLLFLRLSFLGKSKIIIIFRIQVEMQLTQQEFQTTTNPIKIKTSYLGCVMFLIANVGSLIPCGIGYGMFYQIIFNPDNSPPLPFAIIWLGSSVLNRLFIMLTMSNFFKFLFKGGQTQPLFSFGKKSFKNRPFQSLRQFQHHFEELRNTNSIKITPSLFIPESKIQNNTPPSISFRNSYIINAEYKLNLQFANNQSRIKYEQMIDEKSVSAQVASESSRFLWKNNQTYINSDYPRKRVAWSYVILFFFCLDWLVQLYASRKIVQCQITIGKTFNEHGTF